MIKWKKPSRCTQQTQLQLHIYLCAKLQRKTDNDNSNNETEWWILLPLLFSFFLFFHFFFYFFESKTKAHTLHRMCEQCWARWKMKKKKIPKRIKLVSGSSSHFYTTNEQVLSANQQERKIKISLYMSLIDLQAALCLFTAILVCHSKTSKYVNFFCWFVCLSWTSI